MGKLIASPYNWKETIKWIWRYFHPSTHNDAKICSCLRSLGMISTNDFIISFVGDLMRLKNEAMVAPSDQVIRILKSSNLVVINLEAPITSQKNNKKNSELRFDFSVEFIERFLETYQLNKENILFTIANNHIGDHGKEGLMSTIAWLDKLGIRYVGSLNQTMPFIINQKIKLGFLAFSQWLNRPVFDERIGIVRLEHVEKMNFREMKESNQLDMLIMLPHWNYEFNHFPRTEIVHLAHQFIERGVDLIAGHHSHVPGPIEMIDDKYCHYGLGNFFPKTLHWATHMTGIWQVGLNLKTDRHALVSGYVFHPFYVGYKDKKHYMYALDELDDKLRSKIKTRFNIIYPENNDRRERK